MRVCPLTVVVTGISVRVVRAPMPAEQLLSVMFDLKSLASQLLASGPAPAASPKAVAATEDVVLAGECACVFEALHRSGTPASRRPVPSTWC